MEDQNKTNGGSADNVLATRKVNPFALYSQLYGGEDFFEGDYVRLSQEGPYVRGPEKEEIDATALFVVNLQEARHGWINFDGERPKRLTVYIRDNPEGIPRESCGDNDPRYWKKQGKDPWVPTVYLPMRDLSDNSIVCFNGMGQGASKAMGELCRIYARPGADRGGKMPVLLLESFTFENRSGGTTRWPRFKIVDWQFFEPDTPAPPVELIEVSATEPPKPKAIAAPKVRSSDMDDTIPFALAFFIVSTAAWLVAGGSALIA
jgi:hypothetical protein